MVIVVRLQKAADLLKAVTSGGVSTKNIALGITNKVSLTELRYIASPPVSQNVILVPTFDKLNEVQQQLGDGACTGKHDVSFAIVPHIS